MLVVFLLRLEELEQVHAGTREHRAVGGNVVTPHRDDDITESTALAQGVEVRKCCLPMLRVVKDEHRLRGVVISHLVRSPVNNDRLSKWVTMNTLRQWSSVMCRHGGQIHLYLTVLKKITKLNGWYKKVM